MIICIRAQKYAIFVLIVSHIMKIPIRACHIHEVAPKTSLAARFW